MYTIISYVLDTKNTRSQYKIVHEKFGKYEHRNYISLIL